MSISLRVNLSDGRKNMYVIKFTYNKILCSASYDSLIVAQNAFERMRELGWNPIFVKDDKKVA